MTDLSLCSALSVGSFLMRSRPQASFLLLYSTVSVCRGVCLREKEKTKHTVAAYMHVFLLYLYAVFTCMHVCFSVYPCMCVSSFFLHCSFHSARHSMYSSALLIAGCWSKIIVIFQPVGLKSYNIMKCIKKRGKWQTGGMLNQM